MIWLSGLAQASTIFWGSPFNSLLLDSSAQPLDGNYSFEMGTFGSFVPTYQNTHLWNDHWKILDRAFDPTPADPNDGDPEGWNVPDQFFVGTLVHNTLGHSNHPDANPPQVDPAYVFAEGEKVYLWVYNNKTNLPGTEWALVTNVNGTGDPAREWQVPDPSDEMGSYDWQLEDADTAIIGGVNEERGDGFFFSTPGTFTLQTAVVPEPSSALLLMTSAAIFFRRSWRTRAACKRRL
jgi:hypothetical protein